MSLRTGRQDSSHRALMGRGSLSLSTPYGNGAETTRPPWRGQGLRADRSRGSPGGWLDRTHPLPTATRGMAPGQLEPLKGDALRKVQANLSRCALLIGDERGIILRAMIGWDEYNASLAETSRMANSVAPWGVRPVGNLLWGDLQLPSALDTPRYDRSDRGPSANRGHVAHDGFGDAVKLRAISRHVGKAMEESGAPPRASGTTALLGEPRNG